jgi:hypothetical protein
MDFLRPPIEFPDLMKEWNTDVLENTQVEDITHVIIRRLKKLVEKMDI